MKKLFMLLALCAFIATACDSSSDSSSAPTVINVIQENVTVEVSSAVNEISYLIENPIKDLSVEATANVEWIHSFDYSNSNKISFTTDTNPLFEERVGTITVTYGEVNDTVTVTQSCRQQNSVVAPYLLGEYYGDYARANYNYYIVLSSSDYDANNPLYAAGWKYFLDIYADTAPIDYNNIRIPNGVYTLTSNGGAANTLFDYYSIYQEYDNSGFKIYERTYAEATLTVTDDLVKLEIVFEDSLDTYVVTYSGDYTILDKRDMSGGLN